MGEHNTLSGKDSQYAIEEIAWLATDHRMKSEAEDVKIFKMLT